MRENTEWHRVVVFGKLAEVAGEYLRKGAQVYIEGQLRSRKWTDQSGLEKYVTEVVVNVGGTMQMLGGRRESQPQSDPQTPPPATSGAAKGKGKAAGKKSNTAPQQPPSQPDPGKSRNRAEKKNATPEGVALIRQGHTQATVVARAEITADHRPASGRRLPAA